MIRSRREIQPLLRARLPGVSQLAHSDQGRRLPSLPPPHRCYCPWVPESSRSRQYQRHAPFLLRPLFERGTRPDLFRPLGHRYPSVFAANHADPGADAGGRGRSVHPWAWYFARLSVSISSAYRWVAKWLKLTAHIRTALCLTIPPPGKADAQSESGQEPLRRIPVRSRPRPNQNRRSQTGQRRAHATSLAAQRPGRTRSATCCHQPETPAKITISCPHPGLDAFDQTEAGNAGKQPAKG